MLLEIFLALYAATAAGTYCLNVLSDDEAWETNNTSSVRSLIPCSAASGLFQHHTPVSDTEAPAILKHQPRYYRISYSDSTASTISSRNRLTRRSRGVALDLCRSVQLLPGMPGQSCHGFAACSLMGTGQGLITSSTTIVGSTNNALRLQQLYKSSQAWKIDYNLSPKSACSSRNSKSLCAAAATDAIDAYYKLVMATSPSTYSTTDSSQAGAAGLVAPPGDQKECNTCSAFAVAAAAATAMASALRVKAQNCSISVQALYFCPPDGPAQICTAGWDLPSVLAQLQARGQTLPTADCLPYKPDFKRELSKADRCTGGCNDTNAYASLGEFSTNRVTTMWEAQLYIRQYGSVVTRFEVFSDFRPFFDDKRNAKAVYKPSKTAMSEFNHAVVLVGYDNEKQFWLVKNSWGTGWGDGGFFRVAYGECSVLTPGTGEAYFVTWSPYSTPAAIKLPVTPASQNMSDCYWYKSRPGDYLSKVAWLAGITLDKFMLDNVGNVEDVSVLPPGTKLLLCNPKPDSIALPAGSISGSSNSPSPPPSTSPPPSPINTDLELESLLKIKASIDTTNILQGWNRDAGAEGGYCAWRGVFCRVNADTVEQIRIWSGTGINGLRGTLPPASAFAGLTYLISIDISYQPGITGTIPDWSGLKRIQDIRLAINSLSGTIPASLGALSQLKVVYLYENKLAGSLPDSLQQLTNLQELDLGTNALTGTMPVWLGKLRKLQFLNLRKNQLTGTVPSSLAACTELTRFFLNGNKGLAGCVPLALRKQLNFSGNNFYTWFLDGTQIAGYCT